MSTAVLQRSINPLKLHWVIGANEPCRMAKLGTFSVEPFTLICLSTLRHLHKCSSTAQGEGENTMFIERRQSRTCPCRACEVINLLLGLNTVSQTVPARQCEQKMPQAKSNPSKTKHPKDIMISYVTYSRKPSL